jgi:RNA polymerase sigma-70 factor (ECF subfamily)
VEAIDSVQEAFLTLLSMPQAREFSLDDEGAGRLMAVLVRNAARNMRRRRHRLLPHESLDGSLAIAADTPSVEALLVAAEEHVALLGCVNQLGDVQRRVLTMRMLEELTPEDVASTLGLSSGNVGVLLHRAKRALVKCLELERGKSDDV